MHEFKLQITSVKDDGNEKYDANSVTFDVITGTPTAAEVVSLIDGCSSSVCNIDYNDEVQAGCFIDLNFEYSVGQVLTNTQKDNSTAGTLSSNDFHGFSAEQIYSVLSKQLNGIRPWTQTDLKVLDLLKSEQRGELGITDVWPDPVASQRLPEYRAMNTSSLSSLAKTGDTVAYSYLQVTNFNRQVKPGEIVRYKKSGFDSAEGHVFLRTAGPAFVVGPTSPPMVKLEAIGRVFLCNVEVEPVGAKSGEKVTSSAFRFITRLLHSIRA